MMATTTSDLQREQLRLRKNQLARELHRLTGVHPHQLNSYAKHHFGDGHGVSEMSVAALESACRHMQAWLDRATERRDQILRAERYMIEAEIMPFVSSAAAQRTTIV